ncbi:MAG: iron ABC transporter permease [Coriobacteriales bacterium]|nr:iron ABC transporter permease [Coriobacteriales bacterium]
MFDSKVSLFAKIGIVTVLFVAFVASFMLGRYPIMPAELFQTIGAHFLDPASLEGSKEDTAIFNIRLPRVIVVMLVGAALAMAGASYQGMFKNPLVSPDLLGASAGASLGACLALLLDLPSLMIQIFAFTGGILAVAGAVWLNKMVRYDPILGLVLGGILVSTLFQSGTSIVKLLADASDKLPAITFWLMGSFAKVDNQDLYLCLIPLALGFAVLLSQTWKLNVLSFGEEEARSMGVNTRRTRFLVIVASTLLSSTSVAIAGIVGWIGLVIPHLARAIVGPNYRVLLPTTMFIGAAYLLAVDDIARLVSSVEIPIGILTSVLGVPFFVVIFRRNMSGWR